MLDTAQRLCAVLAAFPARTAAGRGPPCWRPLFSVSKPVAAERTSPRS